MKTLYLECAMGAAGDMLMGALLELFPEPQKEIERLNALGIPGVTYEIQRREKCGILGTHAAVLVNGQEEQSHDHIHGQEHHEHAHMHEHHEHDHEHEHEHDHEDHGHTHTHHHSSMADIRHIIGHLELPESVRENAVSVYESIAQAESHAHGKPVEEIHFHEVGAMDAVADVVGVCLLMDELGAQRVCASPVHVGTGHVHCAHGILPVPAPATAFLLQGIPCYGGEIQGELCTPTGAALLRRFAAEFGPMPQMTMEKVGYGMGNKDFAMANCVRAILGETQTEAADTVIELQCNLDDMTPEDLGYAEEKLMEAGALDVYTTAIGMKKNRPGVLLSVLAKPEDRDRMTELLFLHTTTLGVRETEHRRKLLTRTAYEKGTPWGPVTVKCAEGWGVQREKPEFEDLRRIAEREHISLSEIRTQLK